MNLELDGCEPFEEETWEGRQVRIGGAVVRVLGPVPRCVVTTQDPVTGVKDFDTLKRIGEFRPLMPPPGCQSTGLQARIDRPAAPKGRDAGFGPISALTG